MDFLFGFQHLTRLRIGSPHHHFLSAGQRLESESWWYEQEWLGLMSEDTEDLDPLQGPWCQGFPPNCTWPPPPPQVMISSRVISFKESCLSAHASGNTSTSFAGVPHSQPHKRITQTFQPSQLGLKIACLCFLWTFLPSNIPDEPCLLYFRIIWR